ncbi:unnamed protein product [Orchesella dallaii]|uniref:Ion transport domain-containing protein n=1 Tax=Orchesella dallaii TaxID=48710 RepID=A0ABP1S4K7_9HEXA
MSGKTKQGHKCTVDCLNRYPIHHAARMGRFKELKRLLDEHCPALPDEDENLGEGEVDASIPAPLGDSQIPQPEPYDQKPHKCSKHKCCPLERDECLGRTPLHYAAHTGNVEKGLRCVKLLLECNALMVSSQYRAEKLRRFVNSVDYNHETALHLAARNEATMIVKELLVNQADLDIKSLDGKCGLMEIYKRTPAAMDDALNQSISYVELCKRDMADDDEVEEQEQAEWKSTNSEEVDFTRCYVDVCLNFYPLLGTQVRTGKGRNGSPVPETTFLYRINRKRMASDVRRQILNNVLVQSFLHFKWNKIKLFCFFAIFFHIVWLALYIGIVIDVFVLNCPYKSTRIHGNAEDSGEETEIGGTTEYPLQFSDGSCEVTTVVHLASAILLVLSAIIGVKEIFQFLRLRSLYIRFENVGQCILLTFIFSSMPNLYLNPVSVISPLHYQVSAFGIFLAWTLFLCQLAKLPRFSLRIQFFGLIRGFLILPDHGIYVEILSRVFKNFLVFITIFSSLLISFVFSFNILLPNSTGFINLSNSVLKVLTMMTGELNYDEIFHDDEAKLVYPFSSHIMYAIFIMVATIILFNLLIGFTVSDIQGLQKDAEVNQISNKLEQIFLMECFLLSTPMQFIFGIFSKVFLGAGRNHILSNIMVTKKTQRHTWMCYHTPIKALPVRHRIAIRDWASKNCVSISDTSGTARSNLFQSSFTRHS